VADDCARSKNAKKMQAAALLFQEIWKAIGMEGIGEQVQHCSLRRVIDLAEVLPIPPSAMQLNNPHSLQ